MSNSTRLNKSISNMVSNILSSSNPDFQGNLKTNPSKYQQLEILLQKVNDEKIILEEVKKNIKEKMESLKRANRQNKALNVALDQSKGFLSKENMNSLRLTSTGIKKTINSQNKRNYVGKLLNPEYFKNIIEHNGQTIKFIKFKNRYHVTDEIFAFLKNTNILLISVYTIDLAHCEEITNDGLINLTKSCPNLQNIDLTYCELITDNGLINLAQSCHNLQSINLTQCNLITDDGLINLAQSCPNLQTINLFGCNLITDDGLINLAQSCPNLQSIYLADCKLITDNGLIN